MDERFKIDSRFFNSESDDQNSVVDEEDKVDDVNYELVKEKSKALSILDDLLGKRSKAVQKTAITQEKMYLLHFIARSFSNAILEIS